MPNFKALRPSIFLSTILLLTACSFVDTQPGSERVVISYDVETCDKIGETHVKVLSKIAGIDRSQDTIAEELTIMARNAALDRASDTIKPISDIADGKQSFALYRCKKR